MPFTVFPIIFFCLNNYNCKSTTFCLIHKINLATYGKVCIFATEMNIDKPLVIGERPELKATIIVFPILLLFMVWLLLQDLTNVWLWIFAVLFLWGTVDTVRDYVRMRKNIAVGTTIVIDKKGVAVENEGESVRDFPWTHIESLTINRSADCDYWTFRIKNLRQKSNEYSYRIRYERGHIVFRCNRWTLQQRVLHLSEGKVKVKYPHLSEGMMKLYRLFSLYK